MPFLRRLPKPSELPGRRPRREGLLLALVAAASLSIVYPVGAQDVSRMCVTRAISQGYLSADECLGLRAPADWNHSHDFRLWAVRIATGGLALLLCAFLVGRVAEGLAAVFVAIAPAQRD